jgi:hypothetical protein
MAHEVGAVFPLVEESWYLAGEDVQQAAVKAADEAIKALKAWKRDHT